ncbi:MAG: TrkA family potassium uptake protein [Clostridia bacterium]|nr:TrkA family potassium uptake protein [Clostridia bacterium]
MRSFCIIGLGCFGVALAESLSEKRHQVLVISEDEEAVNAIANKVTNAVVGDPTSEAVLRRAGVTDYDCAVVCIDDNMNDSILATMTLKEIGIGEVVARAMNARHRKVLQKLGADMVVFPEEDMGDRLAQILVKKDVIDYFSFAEEYSIAEIRVPETWVGQSIIALNIRRHYGITVIAVRRNGKLDVSPAPDVPFAADDTITVMGTDEKLEKLTKRLQ